VNSSSFDTSTFLALDTLNKFTFSSLVLGERYRILKGSRMCLDDQVVTGLSYTVVMTREGQLYSWGSGSHGQLGHGNTQDEYRPLQIEAIDEGINPVVQVSAGVSHTLAVTKHGALYSFGYGANFGLGHGEFVSEPSPRRVQYFTDQEVFLVSAVAGDEHSAAIDSIGQVGFSPLTPHTQLSKSPDP
jgi:alpha-tubulin suppressor-like RCC1 family protein